MAKLDVLVGATSITVNVFIQDSSSTTGAGLTGLVFNSSGLTAYYALPRAAATAITLATLAAVTSAYSSGGFKEIDATNMPGWYRFDIPDAALASGRFVGIHLKGATNMAPLPLEISLTGWNNQDGVRGGLTALPNAAAEAAGGLYTRGTGAGQIKQTNNGEIDSNVTHINNVATTSVTTVKAVQGLTTADSVSIANGGIASTSFAAAAIDAAAIATDAIGAAELAQGAADKIVDTTTSDASVTIRQAQRIFLAALGGKADGGATTTMHYRDTGDTKNVITATVDANGNRTAVTLNP